ncbi:MAG: hypothetical protein WKF66_09805 [Pedobacter sp.]
MKFADRLQSFLPFGYLFLVVLGILKESVFYYQFGINILRYSSLMDILISPIADLTSHPIVLVGFCAILFSLYFALYFLPTKNYNKLWVRKFTSSRGASTPLSANEVKIKFGNLFVPTLAICLFSFFLGIGLGNGLKVSRNILNGNLRYNCNLTYNTNETKEIYLIGSNSVNLFYVEKGNKNIRISPIGAIKAIEVLTLKN